MDRMPTGRMASKQICSKYDNLIKHYVHLANRRFRNDETVSIIKHAGSLEI